MDRYCRHCGARIASRPKDTLYCQLHAYQYEKPDNPKDWRFWRDKGRFFRRLREENYRLANTPS